MAKVTLRNLNDLKRKDSNLGQTMDDVVNHLTQNKTDIAALQALMTQVRKILNI